MALIRLPLLLANHWRQFFFTLSNHLIYLMTQQYLLFPGLFSLIVRRVRNKMRLYTRNIFLCQRLSSLDHCLWEEIETGKFMRLYTRNIFLCQRLLSLDHCLWEEIETGKFMRLYTRNIFLCQRLLSLDHCLWEEIETGKHLRYIYMLR